MIYTGAREALPNGRTESPTLATALAVLEDAEKRHGIVYTAAAVKKARSIAAAAADLRAEHGARMGQTFDTRAAARDYLAGNIDAAAVVAGIVDAAPASLEGYRESARKLTDRTAGAVEAEGARVLAGVSEDTWLKPIRARVADLVAGAHAEADAVGLTEPSAQRPGVIRGAHPWTPDGIALRDTATRHAWERLEDALALLHSAYAVADQLRRFGWLPVVPGRDRLEHYRWLHVDRLAGEANLVREFWLINRHTADPGLWSAAEMAAADRGDEGEADEDESTDEREPARVW